MRKWYMGMAVVVFVALATVVFAQTPGSGPAAGGPPVGGPPVVGGPEGFRGPGSMGGPGMTGRPGMMGEHGAWGPGSDQPGYGARFHGRFGGGAFLGLSKEQLDKMRALRDRFYNETRDLRYEMAQKRLEMKKLFTDPKTDDATLLAKQKEMSGLRVKLMDKMAQMMIEGRKIMTPEQLQKIDRMEMGPGGMGGGMMDGPMMGHGMMGRGMGPDAW